MLLYLWLHNILKKEYLLKSVSGAAARTGEFKKYIIKKVVVNRKMGSYVNHNTKQT